MESAAAKLRKTLRYPSDDNSDDSLPKTMDEQEQENLIRKFEEENDTRNKQFASMLLLFPFLSLVIYLPALYNRYDVLSSMLSISSLLSTAYLLYILHPEHTGLAFLDTLNNPKTSTVSTTKPVPPLPTRDSGPIATYLPYLNLGLCGTLALTGLLRGKHSDLHISFKLVPVGIYAGVLVAKFLMGSFSPRRELQRLKYKLKGA